MAESRMFVKREGITIEAIGRSVQHFLHTGKGLTVQGGRAGQGYVVQAREESSWKKVSGMDLATEVQISENAESILVNIGNAKWADKVGAGVISWFVFAPLAVTAVVGSVKQQKLPKEIFEHIERFIMSGGQDLYMGMDIMGATEGKRICPHCKAEVPADQPFCNHCGGELIENCPSCGTPVGIGSKFCHVCGASMEKAGKRCCAICGEVLPEGVLFCMKCGNKVQTDSVPMEESTGEVTESLSQVLSTEDTVQPVERRVCEKCGSTNEADDIYCSMCGEKLSVKEEPRQCGACGAKIPEGRKFCPKCGTAVE